MDTNDLTEWDKDKEREEFQRMYDDQVKKIEAVKNESLKFVSTSTLTETNEEKRNIETNKTTPDFVDYELNTDIHRAAKDRKYGKLTRVEYEWRPHPTVCKRFNVPNPYTDTKEYGTQKNDSDKRKAQSFSMLTFLAPDTRFDRENKKNLFDEINAEVPVKEGPSHAKIVGIELSQKSTGEIEFEKKDKPSSLPKKEDIKKMKPDVTEIKPEEDKNEKINKNNVYLQVGFKEIQFIVHFCLNFTI